MTDMYRKGILGVVVGDALGCPVQFESRNEVAQHPVTDMRGYGTFSLPEGSWTDDSSLTLALLDSLVKKNEVNLDDIMKNFVLWLQNGEFTPYGYAYDIGRGTMEAIRSYMRNHDVELCGGRAESNNGNGSLMRILPVCIFCVEKGYDDKTAIKFVHAVSRLTHAHMRSQIACGIYYFMVKSVIKNNGTMLERLQLGANEAFDFYDEMEYRLTFLGEDIAHYNRLRSLGMFALENEKNIHSSGYVVDTLEASVWSLITTYSFKDALLKAVNLGLDTDTVGAVTGGLGGLMYGIGGENGIPMEWIDKLQRKEFITELCDKADYRMNS